jgi:manganese-dependent inorganic pyrophosphatase
MRKPSKPSGRQSPVLVVGHQRPDTDSAVAAATYAALLNRQHRGSEYLGVMLGPPTRQTRWLFERADLPLPKEIPDLRRRVGEIARRDIRSVPLTGTLGDTIRLMREFHVSVVPVVAEDGTVAGIMSDRLPMSNFFYHFNMEEFLGVLYQLEDLARALHLRPRHPGNRPANGSLTLEPARVGAGDIFLCGAEPESIGHSAQKGAAAIIVCAATWKSSVAKAVARCDGAAVFQFSGTLMALVSQLPLALPARNLMLQEFTTLRERQTVEEARAILARLPHAAPVLDGAGKLTGIVSRTELLRAARPQVVLVDHFERHQAGEGIADAEILEIVDHHRVGTIETDAPIRVDCRPVGSTATIIAQKFAEAGLSPSRGEALLLLGAMLADTLVLASPTATETDRVLAERLAKRAGVDIQEFGREALAANDDTLLLSPDQLVEKDLKEFSAGRLRFGIGQVETVDRERFDAGRLAELAGAMAARGARAGWDFIALMITDTMRGDSLVISRAFSDAPPVRQLFNGGEPEVWAGCVSRKKQFLPEILKRVGAHS